MENLRPYRLKQWFNHLRWQWYSYQSRRCCQQVGKNLLVKGPCLIRSEGRIKIGDDVLLDPSGGRVIELSVGQGATLSIGNDVYINHGVSITCNIQITIGDGCLIAPDVMIMDDDGHPTDWKTRHDYWPTTPETRLGAPVHLGKTVWLGARAIVLKGVTIGDGAVVAAGAVVTHSFPPRTLVAGVPARVVRSLDG